MRSLRELQEGFARALVTGVPGRAMPGIRADGLSPMQRLGFYRTNVFGNYLEGLRATYRCVENLVGRGCFAYHAERFIRETPSRSGDLNRYGSEFADFLAHDPITDAAPLPAGRRAAGMAARRSVLRGRPSGAGSRAADAECRRSATQICALRCTPPAGSCAVAYPVRRIWQVSQPDYQGDQAVALDEGGDSSAAATRRLRSGGREGDRRRVRAAAGLGQRGEPGRGLRCGPVRAAGVRRVDLPAAPRGRCHALRFRTCS